MKSIVVFNNKGGVGKTTLTCNLASYLASKCEKRVLLVDADPQCNATTYLYDDKKIEQIYSQFSTRTIQKVVAPVQRGDGYVSKKDIPISKAPNFGIDVIMGDASLATTEDFLSEDWTSGRGGSIRGLKTTLTFYDLLQKVESDYDYVFFDVGPSLGALNRSIVLSCDFFLMPMSSDIFCLKAVENIALSLSKWKKDLKIGIERYTSENSQIFPLVETYGSHDVKFIGYVVQQYTKKTIEGNVRPVKAYENIIQRVPDLIEEKFKDFYVQELKDSLKLGEIANYNSLIPLSQTANKPLFLLSGHDGVVGAHFTKVREYEVDIQNIAQRLINNIGLYD